MNTRPINLSMCLQVPDYGHQQKPKNETNNTPIQQIAEILSVQEKSNSGDNVECPVRYSSIGYLNTCRLIYIHNFKFTKKCSHKFTFLFTFMIYYSIIILPPHTFTCELWD